MSFKRKILIWCGLAMVWAYLLIDSNGMLRVAAAILLAVSVAVPILDAAFTRAAERGERQLGNPKSQIPNPK
jgi:hypothetical protein